MFITHCLQWRNHQVRIKGSPVLNLPESGASEVLLEAYRQLGLSYPKFFKMDLPSKLAILSFELLQRETEISDSWHTGLVISTLQGCLDIDLQFEQNRQGIPSPALFVYTLPNIMLGELAIRHQIKGEQCCFIDAPDDIDMLHFYTDDLLRNQQMKTVFCGHIEATGSGLNATLLRVTATKSSGSKRFEQPNLLPLFTESF